MAIPGVTPSSQLLSLANESDSSSGIGALLGLGSEAERAFRAAQAGQMSPIYGKGGFQPPTFASSPYQPPSTSEPSLLQPLYESPQVFSLEPTPVANVQVAGADAQTFGEGQQPAVSEISQQPAVSEPSSAAESVAQSQPGDVTYGALTNMVQENIGDLDVNVPGLGGVNLTNTVVNTVLDQLAPGPVPGLGVVSTITNPTMVDTSWGTPFNTGGGGLIGVFGKMSLENLEDIYSETQAGTPGFDFYKPGDIPGVDTPVGISPGIFGGQSISGSLDMFPSQADLNEDLVIDSLEALAYATDPNSPGRLAFSREAAPVPEAVTVPAPERFTQSTSQPAPTQLTPDPFSFEDARAASAPSPAPAMVIDDLITSIPGPQVSAVPAPQAFVDAQNQPSGTPLSSPAIMSPALPPDVAFEPDPITQPATSPALMPDAFFAVDEPLPALQLTGEESSGVLGIPASEVGKGFDASVANYDREEMARIVNEMAALGSLPAAPAPPTSPALMPDAFFAASPVAAGGQESGVGGVSVGTTDSALSEAGVSDDPGGGDDGCVIATHGVMTGGFTPMEKAKAEIWCQKTYHGKWYGEAFRRGYRAAGKRCIEKGQAKERYQEFKDFVAYGRGVKKGLALGIKYYARTIQFFISGLFISEEN